MPGGINPPTDVMLSWPVPNYKDPVTQPKYVLIFSCIIGPISIALLCARLWVRIHMQHNAGWDDWLMLAAALPMLALTIIFPLVTEVYRFDRHAWDVEYKYFPIQRKFVMAIYALFTLTSGLIKLSILLFYRRLSSRVLSPAFRWTMRITIFVIGAYSIAFILIPIFMCRPISAFWDQVDFAKLARGYEYTCINEGMDVVAHGIISTVQDLVVAFLPTLLCWNLQMPIRQKIALYGIFALGYTSVAMGVMRTYQGYRLFFMTYDVTWVASDIWLWSLLELHIGSMCANAPALKIFFEKVLKVEKLISWTRSRSQSQSYGSKKQASSGYNSIAGSGSRSWSKGCLQRLFHTNGSDRSHGSVLEISYPRVTTVQKNTQIDPSDPSPRDSMTKPLASEYIDVVLRHESYAHDIEMSRLPTSRSSLENDIQTIPSLREPASTAQRGGRPPPLSQVRASWNIEGRRYVWRPWGRDSRVQGTAKEDGVDRTNWL